MKIEEMKISLEEMKISLEETKGQNKNMKTSLEEIELQNRRVQAKMEETVITNKEIETKLEEMESQNKRMQTKIEESERKITELAMMVSSRVPSSCEDLHLLGLSVNGHYHVKRGESIGMVFCDFTQMAKQKGKMFFALIFLVLF